MCKKVQTMPAKGYSKSKFKGEMCIQLIQMFAEGKTSEQFCALYSISEHTFQRWLDTYPMFNDAYLVAIAKAKSFYADLINNHLIEEHQGPKLNMQAIQLIYRTRFEMPQNRIVKLQGIAARTAQEKMDAICQGVEAGHLTADEAQKLASLIDTTIRAQEFDELRERVQQLELARQVGVTDDDFKEVKDDN